MADPVAILLLGSTTVHLMHCSGPPCKSALLVKDPVTSVMSIVTLNQATASNEILVHRLIQLSYGSHTTVSYAFSYVSHTNLLIRRLIRPSHTCEIGALLIHRARYV